MIADRTMHQGDPRAGIALPLSCYLCYSLSMKPKMIDAGQWIADRIAQLSEEELVLVKTVLDEIRAGRPVEHFMPGTKVYADSWGTVEFIVQGTAPWYDENGVAHRKVEIKSVGGGLSGHVHPSELRRVPPYSPAPGCTCPFGPEDAHFPGCPWA